MSHRASNKEYSLPSLLHRASCRLTKYHTTNKSTNYMSFILNHFFKTISQRTQIQGKHIA